jgi:hypothetical protein
MKSGTLVVCAVLATLSVSQVVFADPTDTWVAQAGGGAARDRHALPSKQEQSSHSQAGQTEADSRSDVDLNAN